MTELANPAVATADTYPATPRLFKVACVEKTGTPEGGEGQNWYRYVLESGCSTVTGQRRGSRRDVLEYAMQYTERLNARRRTAQSNAGWRGRKPASA